MKIPLDYIPSIDEEYMNPFQVEYFYQILSKMKMEALKDLQESYSQIMSDSYVNKVEDAFCPNLEEEKSTNFSMIDHRNKELENINIALGKIEEGAFGYCEKSGDPIGLKRLLALPTARYSVEFQKSTERKNKHTYGHYDDYNVVDFYSNI